MKKKFTVAILIEVEADSYDQAMNTADGFADAVTGVSGFPEVTSVKVPSSSEMEHDNDRQRVLYLHPEDQPVS